MSNNGLQESKIELKIGRLLYSFYGSGLIGLSSAILSFISKNKLALIISSASIGFSIFVIALYIFFKIIFKILATQFESKLNAKDEIIKLKDAIIEENKETLKQLLSEKDKTITEKNITIQQLKDNNNEAEKRLLQEKSDSLKDKELRIEDLKSENAKLLDQFNIQTNNVMQLIVAQPRPKDIAGEVFNSGISYKDPTKTN